MSEPQLPKDLQDACDAVFRECPDPYAKSYAQGMMTTFQRYGTAGIPLQCSYLLNNVRQWRGATARAVKAVLRRYEKGGAV